VVTFTCLLRPDRPVDLLLVMLPDLPEHGQEHDHPLSSTPVPDSGRDIAQPDPQFPDRSLQVIGPRAAQFGAPFSASRPHTSSTRWKSLSLRLSSQSRTSGSSSKSYRRRILPLTLGQIAGIQPDAADRGMILAGLPIRGARPERSAAA
jgi:hypothetical protein